MLRIYSRVYSYIRRDSLFVGFMANDQSFFDRITNSIRVTAADDKKPKRVDFPSANPEEKKAADPPVMPTEDTDAASQERNEQWMEEAQEGQLTIDVYQTDADLIIKSTVAGVKPEDLDISITNDMVTIRGKRTRDEEIPQEKYFYQECYWGPFSRTVILPADVASDEVEATLRNGILTVRLPKIEKEQTKKIKVKNLP